MLIKRKIHKSKYTLTGVEYRKENLDFNFNPLIIFFA